MSMIEMNARVRVCELGHPWDGKVGHVTRTPDMPANPEVTSKPSGSYAVQFNGETYSSAPFHDVTYTGMDKGALIIPEED